MRKIRNNGIKFLFVKQEVLGYEYSEHVELKNRAMHGRDSVHDSVSVRARAPARAQKEAGSEWTQAQSLAQTQDAHTRAHAHTQ